jgi:hypothetical protein
VATTVPAPATTMTTACARQLWVPIRTPPGTLLTVPANAATAANNHAAVGLAPAAATPNRTSAARVPDIPVAFQPQEASDGSIRSRPWPRNSPT